MRKTVRRALREAREHLGIQLPILRLVLRSEDAALGGSVKAFLEVRRVDAAQEFLECGSSGGECGRILRLELAEILTNRFDRPRPGRQGGEQTDQCFIDSPRNTQ